MAEEAEIDDLPLFAELVNDHDGLIAALRKRKAQVGLSDLSLDDLTGLTSGYSGKVLTSRKRPGRVSLGLLLSALGLRLLVLSDGAVEKRMRHRWTRRSEHNVTADKRKKKAA